MSDKMFSSEQARHAALGRLSWLTKGLLGMALIATLIFTGSAAPRVEAATTVIEVGDFWFCNDGFLNQVCPTTIVIGDTVEWNFNNAFFVHNSTDCGTGCPDFPDPGGP